MNDAPSPWPQPPVDSIQVEEIVWGPDKVVIACPACGACGGWSLCVQPRPWFDGEKAWAVCSAGHVVQHPLIYPRFVRAVIGWANSSPPRPPLARVLDDIGWQPHRANVIHDLLGTSANPPSLVYAPIRDWAAHHPELMPELMPEFMPDVLDP